MNPIIEHEFHVGVAFLGLGVALAAVASRLPEGWACEAVKFAAFLPATAGMIVVLDVAMLEVAAVTSVHWRAW